MRSEIFSVCFLIVLHEGAFCVTMIKLPPHEYKANAVAAILNVPIVTSLIQMCPISNHFGDFPPTMFAIHYFCRCSRNTAALHTSYFNSSFCQSDCTTINMSVLPGSGSQRCRASDRGARHTGERRRGR